MYWSWYFNGNDTAETHSRAPTSPELINLSEPSGSVSMTSSKDRPKFLATSASSGVMQGIPKKGKQYTV